MIYVMFVVNYRTSRFNGSVGEDLAIEPEEQEGQLTVVNWPLPEITYSVQSTKDYPAFSTTSRKLTTAVAPMP